MLKTGKPLLASIALAFTTMACGGSPMGPDGAGNILISAYGFRVVSYDQKYLDDGGTITQAHADLADRWWAELMGDLRVSGYESAQTDPTRNAEWVFIELHTPLNGNGSIMCPGRTDTVGGCYDPLRPAFHVPGNYPTATWPNRPASQALKHEMLHHWCRRTLGHLCLEPGKSEWDGHHWIVPNGTDIWDFTWR